MKTLRIVLPMLLLGSGLAAATPRFYITGQVGGFNADAGSTSRSIYVAQEIKSGTKSFADFSLGMEVSDWFSLEVGYVEFDSFSSAVFRIRPEFHTIRAAETWITHDLQGFRLTPVFRVFSTDRFALKILGGVIHPTGKLVQRDRLVPGYRLPSRLDDFGFHGGVGASYDLSSRTTLEGRITHYDFGKPELYRDDITSMNYSLGLSWRF